MSDPLFFDDKPAKNGGFKQKMKSFNPYVISTLSMGTLVIIALSIWAFYPNTPLPDESLPVIRASAEPVRIQPEDAEITETAGYNSRIYETFGQPQGTKRIENLLKPQQNSEVPIQKEELFAGLKSGMEQPQQNQTISITESPFAGPEAENESLTSPQDAETPSEEVAANNEPETFIPEATDKIAIDIPEPSTKHNPGIFAENTPPAPPAPVITETPQETEDIAAKAEEMEKTEPAAGAIAKAATVMAPSADPAGTHYVQLASIKDSSKTVEAWKKLTSKHASLQNISFRTQSADIAGKGTFYRIQAGPLSKEKASALCEQIKAESGSCFVTSK